MSASSAAATMPGASAGSVTYQKACHSVGAQIHGGLFERGADGAQPRRDHDHHVGDAKRHVRQDDGVHAELPVQPAEGPLEQRQQRDAGDDLGRDQREVQRAR